MGAYVENVLPWLLGVNVSAKGPGRGAIVVPHFDGFKVGWVEAGFGCFEGAGGGEIIGVPSFESLVDKWELLLEISVLGGFREWRFDDGFFAERVGRIRVR